MLFRDAVNIRTLRTYAFLAAIAVGCASTPLTPGGPDNQDAPRSHPSDATNGADSDLTREDIIAHVQQLHGLQNTTITTDGAEYKTHPLETIGEIALLTSASEVIQAICDIFDTDARFASGTISRENALLAITKVYQTHVASPPLDPRVLAAYADALDWAGINLLRALFANAPNLHAYAKIYPHETKALLEAMLESDIAPMISIAVTTSSRPMFPLQLDTATLRTLALDPDTARPRMRSKSIAMTLAEYDWRNDSSTSSESLIYVTFGYRAVRLTAHQINRMIDGIALSATIAALRGDDDALLDTLEWFDEEMPTNPAMLDRVLDAMMVQMAMPQSDAHSMFPTLGHDAQQSWIEFYVHLLRRSPRLKAPNDTHNMLTGLRRIHQDFDHKDLIENLINVLAAEQLQPSVIQVIDMLFPGVRLPQG